VNKTMTFCPHVRFSLVPQRIIAAAWVLVPLVARANPVMLDPSSLLAFGIVVFWAFVVEAGVVALLLTFRGVAPLRIFFAYLLGNAAVFFFVFQPLLESSRNLPVLMLEILVIVIDGLIIKLLVTFDSFQGDSYRGVSWVRSTAISSIGNGISYFVGYLAARRPWEVH
jgi:hypothetical protein